MKINFKEIPDTTEYQLPEPGMYVLVVGESEFATSNQYRVPY